MIRLYFLICIFIIAGCGSGGSSAIINQIVDQPPSSSNQFVECTNYDGPLDKVIWLDDFIETSYTNNWTSIIGNGAEYGIPGWGNNERQYYTNSVNNIYILNGCLRITPLNEYTNGFNYTSGKLETKNKVDFTYPGKITVKFRSPEGVGMWPAIWMMPSESIYGGWPASGEIDLAEIRGNNMQEILSTIHFGSDPSNHKYLGGSHYLSQDDNLNEKFHTISLIWEEDSLKFFLNDDISVFEITKSQIGFDENYPFNEVFYLILNVAVGGNFVGNYVENNDLCSFDDLASCSDNKRLLIDWVLYETL